MLKSKKALVMSVLCAVASAGFVASASAADTTKKKKEIRREKQAKIKQKTCRTKNNFAVSQ